ncbi:hypothetical protein FGB62_220g02 [Gracilaria domingensis]|nr:hypothetical protein FGB62_220g02 [Gracilaria domingensis]
MQDLIQLPFAKVHKLIALADAKMLVMSDEGLLASERIEESGKFTKEEAVSMCISLLDCMKALNDRALLLGTMSASNIICSMISEAASKVVITEMYDCTQFYNYAGVRRDLIFLLYTFFDLWVEEKKIRNVYDYNLWEVAAKLPEYAPLIDYVQSLAGKEIKPDYKLVRKMLEMKKDGDDSYSFGYLRDNSGDRQLN